MPRKELIRSLKFFLFSTSAGIIELGVFSLLNELTAWSYWPCYLIALAMSVLWNFTLNRRFTFQSAGMISNFVLEFLYQRFVVFRNSLDTNQAAKKKQE